MKFKRFMGCILLLAAVLVFAVFPASATGTADPLYQMPVEAGQQLPDDVQAAAATLREGMKQCKNIISVSFSVDADSFDGTRKAADALAEQVQALSLAHTGVPNEGDYLLSLLLHMEPTNVTFFRSGDGWQVNVNYYCAYWSTAEQEAELDAEIANLVQLLDLKGDQTDYQKVAAIYNYICSNVRYDYEHKEDNYYALKQTAYAAAIHKTAVCQGYASLFYRLALEAGVDCRYITGFAGENHAWNLVKLDGQYYYLDSTWDEGLFQYGYFLKSALDFGDHKPDDRYMTEEFQSAHPIAQQSYQHPQAEGISEDGFVYYVNNGIAILTGYTGSAADVVVPARLDGYPLLEIAGRAFYYNNSITSITFSEGIQIINAEAIWRCPNLKEIHLPSTVNFTGSNEPDFQCRVMCGALECASVETITVAEGNPYLTVHDGVLYNKEMTILRYYPAGDPREVFEIPEGVLSIGAYAFDSATNLKEVVMPDTVLRLQMGVFRDCAQLEKITISNSCHFIDQYVFENTALESIHIPASVKMLYAGSFGQKSMLKTITVDPENPYYYVVDNVLYGRYTTENVIGAWFLPFTGDWLVKYPAGTDALSFTVPEGIIGIEAHAFDSSTNLTAVTLPDSLQIINFWAFGYCSKLTELKLPDYLKQLHNFAFAGCNNLITLVIPSSVEFLSYYVAGDMPSLENLVFLGDAPELSDQTFVNFSDNGLDIYYPAGNTTWETAKQLYAGNADIRWHEACVTHQFESVSKAASYDTAGYEGQKCSVCGLVEVMGEITPATGIDPFQSESSTTYSPLDEIGMTMDEVKTVLYVIFGIPAAIFLIILIRCITSNRKKK